MNKKYVFDTQALLSFYLGEKGAEKVANMLQDVLEGKIAAYINIVNLAELYYILARKSEQLAEEKEQNLRGYGLKVVAIKDDDTLWKEAARLKANHPVALADAFAAATAKTKKAVLVVGKDPEFDKIKGVPQIEKIS